MVRACLKLILADREFVQALMPFGLAFSLTMNVIEVAFKLVSSRALSEVRPTRIREGLSHQSCCVIFDFGRQDDRDVKPTPLKKRLHRHSKKPLSI